MKRETSNFLNKVEALTLNRPVRFHAAASFMYFSSTPYHIFMDAPNMIEGEREEEIHQLVLRTFNRDLRMSFWHLHIDTNNKAVLNTEKALNPNNYGGFVNIDSIAPADDGKILRIRTNHSAVNFKVPYGKMHGKLFICMSVMVDRMTTNGFRSLLSEETKILEV